jgi:hypothetical protein
MVLAMHTATAGSGCVDEATSALSTRPSLPIT